MTRRSHPGPRLDGASRLTVVLFIACACGCATTPAIKPAPNADTNKGGVVVLTRVHERAVFEKDAPSDLTSPITDSYRVVPFRLQAPARMEARVLGDGASEPQVLVPRTELSPGDHYLVVTYEDVASGIGDRRDFTLELLSSDDEATVVHSSLRGTLAELIRGDMLGQTIHNGVRLHDGHFTARMEDLRLYGRGPWLSMERDYSNRPSPQDFDSVLGPGWVTALPLQLELVASGEIPGPRNVPHWVAAQRGAFYPLADLPPSDGVPTRVFINGTAFVRKGERWLCERGRGSTLNQQNDTFVHRSPDGTLYTYPMPKREGIVIPEKGDVSALPRAMLEPPPPALLRQIEDRNHNKLTLTYKWSKSRPLLAKATDCVGRKFEYEYAELDHVAGPGSRVRLVRVTGPGDEVLSYRYDENGLLSGFQIADYVEEYEYGAATGSPLNPHFNLERIRRPVQGILQELSISYFKATDLTGPFLRLYPGLPATGIVRSLGFPGGTDVFFYYEPDRGNSRTVTVGGSSTVYRINKYGNVIEQESKGQPTKKYTWSIEQGRAGNFMTSYAEGNRVTKYEHDARGKVTRTEYPDGSVVTQSWDPFGQLLERRSPQGLLERHTYDKRGNEVGLLNANGESHWAYVANGDRVLAFESAAAALFAYKYDQYGNLSQEVAVRSDGLGWYANYIYDACGRRLRAVGLKEYTEEYRYDPLGRIVFQRLNDKWRVHSYGLSGDSRVIASSDDEKGATPKPVGSRKKK